MAIQHATCWRFHVLTKLVWQVLAAGVSCTDEESRTSGEGFAFLTNAKKRKERRTNHLGSFEIKNDGKLWKFVGMTFVPKNRGFPFEKDRQVCATRRVCQPGSSWPAWGWGAPVVDTKPARCQIKVSQSSWRSRLPCAQDRRVVVHEMIWQRIAWHETE